MLKMLLGAGDMKSVLKKDSTLKLKHTKWFRNIEEENIVGTERTNLGPN